jgi:hypothetical protein
MDWLVNGVLQFLLCKILLWKVSKRTVWILGSVVVFPGLIHLVVLLAYHSFQLVLACIERKLHCIWEARLSLRRELAMELCWSFGSMTISYKIRLVE